MAENVADPTIDLVAPVSRKGRHDRGGRLRPPPARAVGQAGKLATEMVMRAFGPAQRLLTEAFAGATTATEDALRPIREAADLLRL